MSTSRLSPARSVALALSLLWTTSAVQGSVREPPDGLTIDHGRPVERRGSEVLHPLKVDRRKFEATGRGRTLELPSTNHSTQPARFLRSEKKGRDWTWIGEVETVLGPQATVITFGDDAVFGTIPQLDGPPLRIETRHGKAWLVEGEERRKMHGRAKNDALIPAAGDASAGTAPPSASATATTTSGPVIDVLVAYTPSLVTYYGSASAALTRLSYLESLTNQAYADTPTNVRIRVVGRNLLNYTAGDENDALLNTITKTTSSPVKQQVDSWRQQTGADLVTVVRAFNNATMSDCGTAWIGNYHGQGWSSSWASSVVADGSNGGYYCHDQTFAHELGHNMGSNHDTETSGGDYGAYSYSRGYRRTLSASTGFATVMAYTDGPQQMLNRFSNPAASACLGQPCGVAGSSDNARGLALGAPYVAAYRATVVPTAPPPTLSIADASISEGNSGTKVLTFHIALSAAAPSAIGYSIATVNGTAIGGADFVALSQTGQTIAAGATGKDVSVTINGDTAVEADETFDVALSAVTGATVADGTARGTITNDDALPTTTAAHLWVDDAAVTEGNSGTRTLTFTVRLTQAVPITVGFDAVTSDGTAVAPYDYVRGSFPAQTIPAGQTSRTLAVTVNGDTAVEANEAFAINLSNANAPIDDARGVATIVNDDGAQTTTAAHLWVDDVSVTEGNSGLRTATFTVRLTQAVGIPVTFDAVTSDGYAIAGYDYERGSFPAQVIAAGQTSRTLSVLVYGDTTKEANEAFAINLSNANAPIDDGRGVATIVNDD